MAVPNGRGVCLSVVSAGQPQPAMLVYEKGGGVYFRNLKLLFL